VSPERFPGGYVGVDLFFVISGFVITSSVLRRLEVSGRFSFKDFWIRRFWRLAPAVGVMSTVVTILGFAFLSIRALHESTTTFLSSYVIFSNAVLYSLTEDYFALPDELNAGLHMWSLSVEEQYYFGFSLLMLTLVYLVGRGKKVAPRLNRVVLVVGFCSLALAALGVTDQIDGWIANFLLGFYSPLPRLWEFALGSLVFFSCRSGWQLPRLVSNGIKIAGILIIMVVSTGAISGGQAPFSLEVLLATFAGGAIILAGTKNQTGSLLENRVLGWFGNISYSLYLWHWPFIVFAQQVTSSALAPAIGGVLSLVPAALSFYLVEKPLARHGFEESGHKLIGGLFVGIPLVILGTAIVISASLLSKLEATVETQSPLGNCAGTVMEVCSWNEDQIGAPIYLIGDSNANHFREPIYEVSLRTGRPFYRLVRGGCPPLGEGVIAGVDLAEVCEEKNTETMSWLDKQQPGLVIVGFSLGYWTASPTPKTEAVEDIVRSLESTVSGLEKMGHSVLIVSPLPVWPDDSPVGPAFCSVWHLASSECVYSLGVQDMEGNSPAVSSLVDTLVNRSHAGEVFKLDLIDEVCPDETCRSRDNDQWIWKDRSHISAPMALAIVKEFELAIIHATEK